MKKKEINAEVIVNLYGENVFGLSTMKNYLSEKAYYSLRKTIQEGQTLDAKIADEIADAMKTWAISKGALYFSHWFQPLNGVTAEKHDSFLTFDREGNIALKFSGEELIKGEPDASSFPSGGLRTTFEACGYTAWDPTSPAFIKEGKKGGTLCIPTVFCSYRGEALDKKTGLLRSIMALSKQIYRLGKLFGINDEGKHVRIMMGFEQEYFLVDKKHYTSRLDLIQTGRTLFGNVPAKHQQMSDHYFGAIKSRVMDFMEALDAKLWKLGIPIKTRHNEVCPAQYELATTYEELNLSIDHNMLIMDILQKTAEQFDLVCLLHEKPYAGVNGSGKHNNWSILGSDGKNWLSPGENPRENAKFLTMICTLMKGVDTYADLVRAMVASAGNDYRLGAQEAPPPILSIFLGSYLQNIVESIGGVAPKDSCVCRSLELGVSALPPLPRGVTDRNRTSPFAFTGNKFEFRSLGSNQSCSGANMALNTIVAEALDEICSDIERKMKEGKEFNSALQHVLKAAVQKHQRILYTGDNYSKEWEIEAKNRGLPNLKTTLHVFDVMDREKIVALFEKHHVLKKNEWKARCKIAREQYIKTIIIEANCSLTIAKTMILPVSLEYQKALAKTIQQVQSCNCNVVETERLLQRVAALTEENIKQIRDLEMCIEQEDPLQVLLAMEKLRNVADSIECFIPKERWPLPSYAEMMFQM